MNPTFSHNKSYLIDKSFSSIFLRFELITTYFKIQAIDTPSFYHTFHKSGCLAILTEIYGIAIYTTSAMVSGYTFYTMEISGTVTIQNIYFPTNISN